MNIEFILEISEDLLEDIGITAQEFEHMVRTDPEWHYRAELKELWHMGYEMQTTELDYIPWMRTHVVKYLVHDVTDEDYTFFLLKFPELNHIT